MWKLIVPTKTAETIQEIDVGALVRDGKKLLLLDIDNTIVPRGDKEAPLDVMDWVAKARKVGLIVCLMSNNNKKHFPYLEEFVDHYAIYSKKPFKANYRRLMDKFGVNTNETVMIGDQIFTDVLGANRVGIYSILVRRQKYYGKLFRITLHWIEDKLWERY